MTAQLDVEALVGRLRRQGRIGIFATSLDGAKIVDYDAAADALEALSAHIAGEDARVAAAVAGERERAARLCERAAQGARAAIDSYTGAGCKPHSLVYREEAAWKLAAAIRETPSA